MKNNVKNNVKNDMKNDTTDQDVFIYNFLEIHINTS